MTTSIDHASVSQERLNEIGRAGERWKAHHAEAFAALPDGTGVIINVETGEFVTGKDWHAAYGAFELRYGGNRPPSFSFVVGRPVFIGGGWWQK